MSGRAPPVDWDAARKQWKRHVSLLDQFRVISLSSAVGPAGAEKEKPLLLRPVTPPPRTNNRDDLKTVEDELDDQHFDRL